MFISCEVSKGSEGYIQFCYGQVGININKSSEDQDSTSQYANKKVKHHLNNIYVKNHSYNNNYFKRTGVGAVPPKPIKAMSVLDRSGIVAVVVLLIFHLAEAEIEVHTIGMLLKAVIFAKEMELHVEGAYPIMYSGELFRGKACAFEATGSEEH